MTIRNDASITQPDSGGGNTGCVNNAKDLLNNGNFDGTPLGTGWTQAPIDPAAPIVTDATNGLAPQAGTARAWLGGYEQTPNADSLYEDVMVPANATSLVITGFYEVRTAEGLFSGIYDRATVELTTTTGTQLELIKALDDDHATTAYTPLDHTFTNLSAIKGQTVRLKFSSNSDDTYATSFYFDSIKLTVMPCQ